MLRSTTTDVVHIMPSTNSLSVLFDPRASPPILRALARFATVPSPQLCALAYPWNSTRDLLLHYYPLLIAV